MPNATRRQLLSSVPLTLAASAAEPASASFPFRTEFPVVEQETCLNNARWHPLSRSAMSAVRAYLDFKASGGMEAPDYSARQQRQVKEQFARLINAQPSEISFTPSTSAGENAVVSALGLTASGAKVVTDALHFEGSLYMYGELAKRGLKLEIVRPRNWRITLEDLDRAITRDTKLVAISLVSMMTGFEHDLKAVCDLAHSRGALVFADIVQAAGAVPVDVRASGVDFCSCASYKWLMGDMGVGFLYVRQEHLERLTRPVYGYRQLTRMDYHLFPHDPPGTAVFDWTAASDAGGHFEIGTVSNTTVAALSHSLPFLLATGIERIEAHRQPLLRRLEAEMPRRGFTPLTPAGSKSPIATYAKRDAGSLGARLREAKIDVSVAAHRIRISPSVYNTMADVDRLLELL